MALFEALGRNFFQFVSFYYFYQELELRLEGLQKQESWSQLFEKTMQQLPALQNKFQKLKEENSLHKYALNVEWLYRKWYSFCFPFKNRKMGDIRT